MADPSKPDSFKLDNDAQQLVAMRVAEEAKKQIVAWAKWMLAACGIVLTVLGIQLTNAVNQMDRKIETAVDARVKAILDGKMEEIDKRSRSMIDHRLDALVQAEVESKTAIKESTQTIENLKKTASESLDRIDAESRAAIARFQDATQQVERHKQLSIARLDAIISVSVVPGDDEQTPEAEAGLSGRKKLWAKGTTIRVGFMNGDDELQERVQAIASQWTEHANLKFEFGPAPGRAQIRIKFAPEVWAYVGTDCLQVPINRETMSLNKDAADESTFQIDVLTHFGHALGLMKEHQQPSAMLPWDRAKVYSHYARTAAWSRDIVDRQLFQKLEPNYYGFDKPFDPDSIMMMAFPGELFQDGVERKRNTTLSDGDKELIKKLYPFD
jgi:hypothetical protein